MRSIDNLAARPEDPTPAEVEEHEATEHIQYRDWCRHCIAGRGIGQPHRTRRGTEGQELSSNDSYGLHVYVQTWRRGRSSKADHGGEE